MCIPNHSASTYIYICQKSPLSHTIITVINTIRIIKYPDVSTSALFYYYINTIIYVFYPLSLSMTDTDLSSCCVLFSSLLYFSLKSALSKVAPASLYLGLILQFFSVLYANLTPWLQQIFHCYAVSQSATLWYKVCRIILPNHLKLKRCPYSFPCLSN